MEKSRLVSYLENKLSVNESDIFKDRDAKAYATNIATIGPGPFTTTLAVGAVLYAAYRTLKPILTGTPCHDWLDDVAEYRRSLYLSGGSESREENDGKKEKMP